jgi:mRNA-degrading endonuclease RelE of RelBE toxin-antitoxin system
LEVVIEVDRRFERDFKRLPPGDGRRLQEKVDYLANLLLTDRPTFFRHARRIRVKDVGAGLESSLHSIRVTPDLRLIATIDDDPVFEQTIITLLRVVSKKDEQTAFLGMMESLYQGPLDGERHQEGRHGTD